MTNEKVAKIKKLPDSLLENVSGGNLTSCKTASAIAYAGLGIAMGGGIGTVSCAVASAVYSSKASKAAKQGDIAKSIQYSNTASKLSTVGASMGGVAIAAATMNIFVGAIHLKLSPKHNCTA